MAERGDEFYVGWEDRAPGGLAAAVRKQVIAVLAVGSILAVSLIASQRDFAPSVFEYGVVRELTGIVRELPAPMLLVERPGVAGPGGAQSAYLLVAVGKHGADATVAGLDGRAVRLRGSLIYRDGRTAVEIEPGSVQELDGAEAERLQALDRPGRRSLGEATLIGEIVDSKCFLGTMKPGNLKPHRACAVRCISGGAPPLLVVRDGLGRATQFLLVGSDGQTVHRRVLDFVAEPVEITGRVELLGDLLVLYSDPATYRRL